MAITDMEVHARPAPRKNAPPEAPPEPKRYLALDAYRGFIMLILASEGFGFSALQGDPVWGRIAHWFHHVPWAGGVFWDMIQPAFMFMVGVAMPFALARRRESGADRRANFRPILADFLRAVGLSDIALWIEGRRIKTLRIN